MEDTKHMYKITDKEKAEIMSDYNMVYEKPSRELWNTLKRKLFTFCMECEITKHKTSDSYELKWRAESRDNNYVCYKCFMKSEKIQFYRAK